MELDGYEMQTHSPAKTHHLAATIGKAVVRGLAGTLTKEALARCENVLARYDVTTDCSRDHMTLGTIVLIILVYCLSVRFPVAPTAGAGVTVRAAVLG